jgi:hypothetical protein
MKVILLLASWKPEKVNSSLYLPQDKAGKGFDIFQSGSHKLPVLSQAVRQPPAPHSSLATNSHNPHLPIYHLHPFHYTIRTTECTCTYTLLLIFPSLEGSLFSYSP